MSKTITEIAQGIGYTLATLSPDQRKEAASDLKAGRWPESLEVHKPEGWESLSETEQAGHPELLIASEVADEANRSISTFTTRPNP